ncbi:MAG: methyltransferase domain-containing protein [Lachnospiraceae bacterium]|nr:methyltransferase domain-containing protein [Lachnospiraceae bacterium]
MSTINLRIYDLRKTRQLSQKDLADELGVSVQTVSKWENHVCMPDITMLPDIARFFQVSVDELLGLSPLTGEEYIPVRSGEKDYWDSRLDYLKASRKTMWNDDYIGFLVKEVWKIDKPVNVLDCGCGFGYMRMMLMPLFPEGSTYTGIDFNAHLLQEAENLFQKEETGYKAEFVCDDFIKHSFRNHYDVTISQCTMRHVNEPQKFLQKMIAQTKSGGMVVAIDVNRELESDGLYIDGMDYAELCQRTGFRKMWIKEKEYQGRDYAIGMRLPLMMREEGLRHVDVRMNDRVTFVYPECEDYAKAVECFLEEKNWRHGISAETEEKIVREFMNHGMDRKEAENYCRIQRKMQAYMAENKDSLKYLHSRGLLISYGWKSKESRDKLAI